MGKKVFNLTEKFEISSSNFELALKKIDHPL